ncbi:MAG TPA: hypothetical protein VMT53_04275 [Terriglobales bacterium]|nr:hypothetical protein [Terriglobales bacterium]
MKQDEWQVTCIKNEFGSAPKMERHKPGMQFWAVLITTDILALVYPILCWHRAVSRDERLFAGCTLAVVTFLLMVVDTFGIAFADVLGDSQHRERASKPHGDTIYRLR